MTIPSKMMVTEILILLDCYFNFMTSYKLLLSVSIMFYISATYLAHGNRFTVQGIRVVESLDYFQFLLINYLFKNMS